MSNTRTYTLKWYLDDMGSLTSTVHGWSDALWHINSARDHDGLPHITMSAINTQRRKSMATLTLMPKYTTEWTIQGHYGSHGWEDENTEASLSDARRSLKEYRDNGPGSYRIISRRVKVETKEG